MSVTMKKGTTCWTFGVGVGRGLVNMAGIGWRRGRGNRKRRSVKGKELKSKREAPPFAKSGQRAGPRKPRNGSSAAYRLRTTIAGEVVPQAGASSTTINAQVASTEAWAKLKAIALAPLSSA